MAAQNHNLGHILELRRMQLSSTKYVGCEVTQSLKLVFWKEKVYLSLIVHPNKNIKK